MFIEIYKTISEKTRAARHKQRQSVPEDTQEIQNLTGEVNPFGVAAQKRQEWFKREQTSPIRKFHFRLENTHNLAHSDIINIENSQVRELSFNAGADNSMFLEMNPRNRIHPLRPIIIQHRPRTLIEKPKKAD